MPMRNSSARSSIDVGSVIAGTYTIEALVGRGGMGAVFLASHNRLPGKKVAIKLLHDEMSGDEILARFKREAQIASLLSHPNIVHIEDYNVTADGMPYLVLEYLQGESLAQRLQHGALDVDQTFSIMRQVGSALAAAHGKGIVHRDLKQANIFLSLSEIEGHTREIAKVLDFGISKIRDSQTVKTQDSALLGTPQYMAPEQALGQHDKVDERTDVFALGAIVYEMLSGVAAFGGQTIPEVVFKVVYEQPVDLATRAPLLSGAIVGAVQTAMSKSAEDRYGSVTAFIEALTGSPVSLLRRPVLQAPDVGFAAGSSAPALRAQSMGQNVSPNASPNVSKEALAETMGSGDHGASPIANTMPSHPPIATAAAAAVQPHAATLASLPGTTADAGPNSGPVGTMLGRPGVTAAPSAARSFAGATGATAALTSPETSVSAAQLASRPSVADSAVAVLTAQPRRGRGALIAIALLAFTAGIGGYFMTGGAERAETRRVANASRSSGTTSQADSSAPITDHAGAATISGGSAGPNAAVVSGAGAGPNAGSGADVAGGSATDRLDGNRVDATPGVKADPKADTKKSRATAGANGTPSSSRSDVNSDADGESGPGDGGSFVRTKLLEAEAALGDKRWADAERVASLVVGSEEARPKQKAIGRAIGAIAACHLSNDQERAITTMRTLGRAPLLRRRVLEGCQAAGTFKKP